MDLPTQFKIREILSELRKLQKQSNNIIGTRIRVLIEFKKYDKEDVSKKAATEIVGENHNSVQYWQQFSGSQKFCALHKH